MEFKLLLKKVYQKKKDWIGIIVSCRRKADYKNERLGRDQKDMDICLGQKRRKIKSFLLSLTIKI